MTPRWDPARDGQQMAASLVVLAALLAAILLAFAGCAPLALTARPPACPGPCTVTLTYRPALASNARPALVAWDCPGGISKTPTDSSSRVWQHQCRIPHSGVFRLRAVVVDDWSQWLARDYVEVPAGVTGR